MLGHVLYNDPGGERCDLHDQTSISSNTSGDSSRALLLSKLPSHSCWLSLIGFDYKSTQKIKVHRI